MIQDLSKEQNLLAEYMSDLSEEAYSAGWMDGLEYALWKILINEKTSYGRLDITKVKKEKLIELSNLCKGWIYFDDSNDETYINIESWEVMYKSNENKTS